MAGQGERYTMIERQVLIVGAGEAGEMVLREIKNNPGLNRVVVGFVDDDKAKQNARVDSVPVLGKTGEVAQICADRKIDEVIIAIPSAPGSVIRSVTRQADRLNADLRIVPGIREIIEGDVQWNQIRTVMPEDLLGRETVEIDDDRLRSFLTNQRVIVTGAAGSIGSQLVEELFHYPVDVVMGLDINESGLYELEASRLSPENRDQFISVLGDIREKNVLEEAVNRIKPDLVLHTAALKHVPMSERHPREVIKTNLAGTRNLLETVAEYQVDDCLVISTDKAVQSKNLMGLSKRLNERMVASVDQKHEDTRFCAVRFGNVLGSRGSVVPLFKEQIRRGGPVTVTDPEVERYFMTPAEAVRLVLTAASFQQGGTLYVLDLGDPIRILDLARQLISLSGHEPETEIPIVFTGLRKGETMEEKLLRDRETPRETPHDQIRKVSIPPLRGAEFNRLNKIMDRPQSLDSDSMSFLRSLEK